MHLSFDEAQALLTELQTNEPYQVPVILAVPSVYALSLQKQLRPDSNIFISAQNIHQENQGAFTGEISASMLKSIGISYTLIGHSERRQYFLETNEILYLKIKQALANQLKPIYCIGETLSERESGELWNVLTNQLNILKSLAVDEMQAVILAYEPVWAIGTGKTASPDQAQEVHAFIRAFLKTNFPSIAENISILYGGSVKADNAKELFSKPDIDGGLVGGASLKAADFKLIIEAAY